MRTTFDAVAEDYDRARPGYPSEVFADLVELAGLSSGARVLEIGCGTGQATLPLVQRGLTVVAVEPGQRLAALMRRRVAGFSAVGVVDATFEEWEPPEDAVFDAAVSFAAFHWVDPETRHAKAAQLLKPSGALAVFDWQDTLSDDGDPFFIAVQDDYAAVVPEWERTAPSPPQRIPDRVKVFIDASGRFESAVIRRYVWKVTFTARHYVTFLGTTGSFGVLSEARRKQLADRIERRITTDHAGAVRAEFLGQLAVARVAR